MANFELGMRCCFGAQHGNSALHECAWRGYSRTVAALAKALGTRRAPLHARNLAGFAPLHLACQNGHNQSCRELLLAGCNPDLQNNVSIVSLRRCLNFFQKQKSKNIRAVFSLKFLVRRHAAPHFGSIRTRGSDENFNFRSVQSIRS